MTGKAKGSGWKRGEDSWAVGKRGGELGGGTEHFREADRRVGDGRKNAAEGAEAKAVKGEADIADGVGTCACQAEKAPSGTNGLEIVGMACEMRMQRGHVQAWWQAGSTGGAENRCDWLFRVASGCGRLA